MNDATYEFHRAVSTNLSLVPRAQPGRHVRLTLGHEHLFAHLAPQLREGKRSSTADSYNSKILCD